MSTEDTRCSEQQDRWTFNADAVGYELVRQYYTVLAEAPEHSWRFYDQWAHYCYVDADGRKSVAANRSRLCHLLIEAGANLGTATDGCSSTIIVNSAHTTRCALDRLLVMATTERFTQSFVVKFKAPRSFVVIASIISYKPANHSTSVDHRSSTRWKYDHDGSGRQESTHSTVCHGKVACMSVDDQLFVGHLSSSSTSKDLIKTFNRYGNILYVRVMNGYNRTGNPSKYNYAFVKFDGPKAVDAVLSNRPIKLCNGNRINVHRSKVQNVFAEEIVLQ